MHPLYWMWVWGAFLMLHTCSNCVVALMPKRLPGGGARGFVPNVERPREDLQVISSGTAALISKNWMQNILLDVMCRQRARGMSEAGEFVYDDLHIMTSIQELQQDFEQSQKRLSKSSWGDVLETGDIKEAKFGYGTPIIYFAWKPKSLQGFNEVLFVVVATLVREEGGSEGEGEKGSEPTFYLDIKNVIQSPFWDEEQIPSIHLKNALIDQNEYTNETTLRFDRLYETNLRYKLAWETWFCGDGEGKE